MPPKERHVDRGARRARAIRRDLGTEIHEARLAAGLTQQDAGRAVGISASVVSRVEAARQANLSIDLAASLLAVVGLELSARAFPAGPPLRDAAHLALLDEFRRGLGPGWRWRAEVAIDRPGDPRAWDAVIDRPKDVPGTAVAIEAETRLRDIQALLRRLDGKRRDSLVDRVILVLADTRGNRVAVRAAASELRLAFPGNRLATLRALTSGEIPGADALLLVRVSSVGRARNPEIPRSGSERSPDSGPVSIGRTAPIQPLNTLDRRGPVEAGGGDWPCQSVSAGRSHPLGGPVDAGTALTAGALRTQAGG
jgi:transcriptional regulator with XRE-family HTH domain